MFCKAISPRHWQLTEELADETIHASTMQAVNFAVFELPPDQRTAIQINARNLATGKNVWTSARLPTDLQARQLLLADAKSALMARLAGAGIL